MKGQIYAIKMLYVNEKQPLEGALVLVRINNNVPAPAPYPSAQLYATEKT